MDQPLSIEMEHTYGFYTEKSIMWADPLSIKTNALNNGTSMGRRSRIH